jgi:hypothetical protein
VNNFASIAMKQDLPVLADKIVAAAGSDPGLIDALKDYEQACERMIDTQTRPEDQALWSEIRTELAADIKRLYLTLIRNKNNHAR